MREIVVSNLKVLLDESIEVLINKISKRQKIPKDDIKDFKIIKESIDARKKENVFFVYTVSFRIPKKYKIKDPNFKEIIPQKPEKKEEYKKEKLLKRPIIVGTGPCGIFGALILARAGLKPIIIEQGSKIEERVKIVKDFWENGKFNNETNVQFGEGGAGSFSDGKLTTQISDSRCNFVLKEFVKFGGPSEIIYKAKPHIGSDKLKNIIINIRKEIEASGGTYFFNTKLTDIKYKNNQIYAIEINSNEEIGTDILVLALGHSARDTFEMIHKRDIKIIPKAFSIGMRIEHLQENLNEARFGNYKNHPKLGKADYALFEKLPDRTIYTFCMCPGGVVVGAGSEKDSIVTNGMSLYNRDEINGNSALVCSVSPKDFGNNPLDGINFQRIWEKKAFDFSGDYSAPIQRLEDFKNGIVTKKLGGVKPSYTGNTVFADLNLCLPNFVTNSIKQVLPNLERRLKGFSNGDAILTGVETRTSSPLRIIRDDNFQTQGIFGIYPAGEGAGYAGGIMSAAVDGIKVAEEIVKKYTL